LVGDLAMEMARERVTEKLELVKVKVKERVMEERGLGKAKKKAKEMVMKKL